jgi:hypothetical protein
VSGNTAPVLVNVYNNVGQPIEEFYMEPGTKQLDLQAFPKGLYYIQFLDKDQLTLKFIRQ